MVTVSAESRQKKLRLNLTRINKIAKIILKREGVTDGCVSFVFVTAPTMRRFNSKYMSRRYATDVLSFDLSDEGSRALVGDIMISTDAALKNAKLYQQSPAREICLYIIHGILHLTGYDDHRKADVARMQKRQHELLDALGSAVAGVLK